MCELSVYMTDNEELVMDGVVRLAVSGEKILLEDIMGRSLEITGRIKEINITVQKALIDPV
ncbi:MAG: CooT family nickel-binding protein [Euryarchaeota archaeon]|nr:CooT family nickel-binding protein [Euryarchaeota archaeon]